LYSYSDNPKDLSNCKDYAQFLQHYGFLVAEHYRTMMPGRIVAVHCMDLPTYKRGGEEIGLKDFPGDIIRLFTARNFVYHSRIAIWKDPLVAATRTKAIGLAHKQICKDSSLCRTGIADTLLAFRKPGENPKPIKNEKGLTKYPGAKPLPNVPTHEDQRKNKRSHLIWQRLASPVWDDIRQTRVLPFRDGKDPEDARHVCPLQLDVIERCLMLWSCPGDIVLTPFCGVGSEVYTAVTMGRKGVGFELKKSYYRQALKNVRYAVKQKEQKNTRI
jgi:DNA modification methylase